MKKNDRRGHPIIAGHATATHGTGPGINTSAGGGGSAGSAILLHLSMCHQVDSELTEIVCRHWEDISLIEGGRLGTCRYCDQERLYPFKGYVQIIKRGKIGGSVTMIRPPDLKSAGVKKL